MNDIVRQSPVRLPSRAVATVVRNHWVVVKEYENEGSGPWLIDLSHNTRWDYQNGRLDAHMPAGLAVPATAGECRLEHRILVSRMNRTQAAIWHLDSAEAPQLPADTGITDISEANALLALLGPNVYSITEKLTDLDCMDPHRRTPFLLQGPLVHVACQIVILAREDDGTGALVLACPRGYAQDMVHAILAAGEDVGLCPAGEERFTSWISVADIRS